MWDECNCVVVWVFFGIAFLWDWNENWPFPVLWPLLSSQICWHIECSTFTASSFRIWNSSTGIPSPPQTLFTVMLSFYLFFLTFYFYFILLYNALLVLPYIDMNPPRVYMSYQSWTPLPPPTHIISLDHPRAPAPSILHPASNIDWRSISYMIVYMFQCHSPKSSHPLPLPQSPKVHSIHLCLLLSRIQGYRYHLSKFHIYVLVYCIGVFLSGLLHSVE